MFQVEFFQISGCQDNDLNKALILHSYDVLD